MNFSPLVKLCPAAIVTALLAPGAGAAEHAFIGAEKCAKTCHNDEKTGAQYAKWLESKHAGAWKTLASDKAREIAKAKGIADPQQADACVKCHQTAHGVKPALLTETYKADEGVGCEACHGAGNDYKKLTVMKDPVKARAAGLIEPNEAVCKRCHNQESPTYQPFDFASFSAKIAHPNPAKAKK